MLLYIKNRKSACQDVVREEKVKMRVVKRTLVYLMILCLVVGNINVIPADAAKKTVKATAVTLNKTSYTLKKGKSVTLKATVKPKNAANKSLVWSSSNKKVATVSQKGKVTAKKNGKATITVKIKNNKKLKATCSITVGTPVSKVSVKSSKVSLYVGDSYQIKTTVTPSKATNKKVSYSSSNKKVATVDSKGKIKAKAAGSATITVKAKDGTGKKAAVKVTVKKKTLVTKVSVTASKKVLTVGETLTLKAAVSPKMLLIRL